MSEVESLESRYQELKIKLSTGAIEPEKFREEVSKLWFEDAQGHIWMIGAQTGHWYVYEDDLWVMGDPPRVHPLAQWVACPHCGKETDLEASFCGYCGLRLKEESPEAMNELVADEHAQKTTVPAPSPNGSDAHIAAPHSPSSRFGRRLVFVALGLIVIGLLLACAFSVFGAYAIRGGALPFFGPTPTPTIIGRARTATPTATATPNPATPTRANLTPTPSRSLTQVPTPIIVVIGSNTTTPPRTDTTPSPANTMGPTPTSPPTLTPSPTLIATTPTSSPAPTATNTPTAPSTTPTPEPTPAPTNTPRPPTNTPVPRPPTNTPTPPITLNGRIAFAIFNTGYTERKAYDVYIANTDGSERQRVAPKDRQPQFHPDGSRLVVRGMDLEKEKLFVRDLGGGEREISNTPLEAANPSWSPDGNYIVYASNEMDDRQSRLYVIPIKGAPEQRQPLRANGKDIIGRYPTWLPSGQIVFAGRDGGQTGIMRVNPDGTGLLMLNSVCGDTHRCIDTAPAGSGNTVVFMSNRDGNFELYSVPLDGGEARNLTNHSADDGLPAFSPDGTFIAFVSNRGGQWAIWTMRPDGRNLKQLFTLDGSYAQGDDLDWIYERISWGP